MVDRKAGLTVENWVVKKAEQRVAPMVSRMVVMMVVSKVAQLVEHLVA